MITDDMIRELCTICTRDEAERHFLETSRYWRDLEDEFLIEIDRPVHSETGMPYGAESWTLHVTDEGQSLVDASEHLYPLGVAGNENRR